MGIKAAGRTSTRRMQADLDAFIRESVASLREETARLATEVLATIDGSENGVHQRTLNRLTTFIDNFRSLNFAGDAQLEQTLERFRRDLLSRTAEEYRNQPGAMIAWIAVAPPERRLICLLALHTGLRRKEMKTLESRDVFLGEPAPLIRLSAGKAEKPQGGYCLAASRDCR